MKMMNNVISLNEVEADLIYKALKLTEDNFKGRELLNALREITPKFKALRDKLLESPQESDFDLDLPNEGWYNSADEEEYYS